MAVRVEYHHCENCEDVMPHNRRVPNHILHLIVSILTGGLWIIVWILSSVSIGSNMKCGNCGLSPSKGRRTGQRRRKREYKEEEAAEHDRFLVEGPEIGERLKVLRGQHKGKFGTVSEKQGDTATLIARNFLFHPLGSLPAEGPGS